MASPGPSYRTLVVASGRSAGGRAAYVFSVAPGWQVTVLSGATDPSPDDAQEVLDACFPRWNIRYPRQPGV